jgi:hypothetical protein
MILSRDERPREQNGALWRVFVFSSAAAKPQTECLVVVLVLLLLVIPSDVE